MPAIMSIILAIFLFAPQQSADKGTYRVLVDGKPTGQEQFEIARSENGFKVKSTGEASVGRSLQKIATSTEIQDDKPVRYTVETGEGENAQKYSMEFSEGAVKIDVEAHGRKTERTRALSRDVMLLDRGVWHHYRFLLARYNMKEKGVQRFKVFIPLSGLREYSADILHVKKAKVEVGKTKRQGDLFSIIVSDTYEVLVFADDARVPFAIEVPAEKTKVLLE